MKLRLLTSLGVLCSLSAWAGGLYLNDVKIGTVDLSGLDGTSVKFDGAKIRSDAKGNLYLDVKGFAVRVENASATVPASAKTDDARPPVLTKRYFLVTEQTAVGMTDFDIDVYVNSKWVRKLRSADDQVVAEITRHLVPGKNRVVLTAVKSKSVERKSVSPEHAFKVIIGEGNVGGDNVMIDNPVITFRRTAAETEDVSTEFSFVTR